MPTPFEIARKIIDKDNVEYKTVRNSITLYIGSIVEDSGALQSNLNHFPTELETPTQQFGEVGSTVIHIAYVEMVLARMKHNEKEFITTVPDIYGGMSVKEFQELHHRYAVISVLYKSQSVCADFEEKLAAERSTVQQLLDKVAALERECSTHSAMNGSDATDAASGRLVDVEEKVKQVHEVYQDYIGRLLNNASSMVSTVASSRKDLQLAEKCDEADDACDSALIVAKRGQEFACTSSIAPPKVEHTAKLFSNNSRSEAVNCSPGVTI